MCYSYVREMNFNVYVDKHTVERIARLANARGTSRNALIREALARLLEQDGKPTWPEAVLAFSGEPKMRRFEDNRRKLRLPKRDPFR